MSEMKLVEVEGLKKVYGKGETVVEALKGVTMGLEANRFVAVLGPSGSGKTTLLSCLGGILKPSAGTITVAGRELEKLGSRELARYRRDTIGFVFQSFNLVPSLSALENVQVALAIAGKSNSEGWRRAMELLEQVDLEKRVHHRPEELSGGEKQRVSIARALANDPKVVLADEPTANLDSATGRKIVDLLENLARQHNKAVVVVTHDERMIDHVDEVYRLTDGRLSEPEGDKHANHNNR